MAVTLLRLSDGNYSLEFEPKDAEFVFKNIRKTYGRIRKRGPFGIATTYKFGRCEFTYQDEWDDPCLISHSHERGIILRTLHNIINP